MSGKGLKVTGLAQSFLIWYRTCPAGDLTVKEGVVENGVLYQAISWVVDCTRVFLAYQATSVYVIKFWRSYSRTRASHVLKELAPVVEQGAFAGVPAGRPNIVRTMKAAALRR